MRRFEIDQRLQGIGRLPFLCRDSCAGIFWGRGMGAKEWNTRAMSCEWHRLQRGLARCVMGMELQFQQS